MRMQVFILSDLTLKENEAGVNHPGFAILQRHSCCNPVYRIFIILFYVYAEVKSKIQKTAIDNPIEER